MRVVIDTNVLISSIFFGGSPLKLIDEIENRNYITTYVSQEIILEYQLVFRRLQKKYPNKIIDEDKINRILDSSNLIYVSSNLRLCRDVKDNKFINCALSAKADYLITGDNDLLVLKKINNVSVITIAEFLKVLSVS